MRDAEITALAGRQFNRISRQQLIELGLPESAIERRLASGRLVGAEHGVFAVAPLLDYDEWGQWMSATLTAPGSVLSRLSAAAARGLWSPARKVETVTRPGNGGPRRFGNVIVHRSTTLAEDTTELRGIPITTVPRMLIDLAPELSERALARMVREAVRLDGITLAALGEWLGQYRGRRGSRRLAAVIARYSGLPIERARSGAEVRAVVILRDSGRPLPRLNVRIAGEEADLSWSAHRLIIEIDGGPFHLDVGEDARKEGRWREAGWTVLRLPSEDVYERPARLLNLAPSANVPNTLA